MLELKVVTMEESKKEAMKQKAKSMGAVLLCVAVLGGGLWFAGGIQARDHALGHANTTKEQVDFIRFHFDLDDLIPQYEVSWQEGTRETEISVHAFTGQLLDYDRD